MGAIKFGWHTPSFPTDGSNGATFIAQIEAIMKRFPIAFDSIWMDDHYWPWASWQPADAAYLECATTMAYFAGAYPNIKIASSVFCQSYRNPGLLAKMAANLQMLTKGNLIFGIGAGWMEREYHAFHIDFPKPAVRLAQLAETLDIIKLLWTETPASYDGKYYKITNAYLMPKPDPIPPIMIGGGGEQLTLKVVAKYADMWNFPGGTYENYAHKLDVLRGHCDAIGRDYDDIVKTWSAECIALAKSDAEARRILEESPYKQNGIAGTPVQVAEKLQRFIDLGVGYFSVRIVDFPRPDGLHLFAEEVIPLLRGQ